LLTPECAGYVVIYKSKDGRQQKAFDALEWLAAMSSHIPDKGKWLLQ
jgi:hypothetical protein